MAAPTDNTTHGYSSSPVPSAQCFEFEQVKSNGLALTRLDTERLHQLHVAEYCAVQAHKAKPAEVGCLLLWRCRTTLRLVSRQTCNVTDIFESVEGRKSQSFMRIKMHDPSHPNLDTFQARPHWWMMPQRHFRSLSSTASSLPYSPQRPADVSRISYETPTPCAV